MAEDEPKRLRAGEAKAKIIECREMAARAGFPNIASCWNTWLQRGSGSLARWKPTLRLNALRLGPAAPQ